MQQPIPTWEPYPRADELLVALGIESSCLPVEAYDNGPIYAYVELETEPAVGALEPDLAALGRLGAGPFAVHLARHGRIAFGDEIEICQSEEIGRPPKLYARAVGSVERIDRVEVAGAAVVVGRGELGGV